MHLDEAIAYFLSHRRDKDLTVGSLALYQYQLGVWQTWRTACGHPAALEDVTAEELRGFFRYLAHEHVPHGTNTKRPAAARVGMALATRDSYWRTIRALWNFLADEALLSVEQLGLFRRDRVPRPRPSDDEADDALREVCDDAVVAALLAAIGPPFTAAAARDRCIILLLAESGMRVSELCGLDDRDLDREQRTARVRGKGRKRRWVFWGPAAAAALDRYYALRAKDDGPVFRSYDTRKRGERLTRDGVRSMLKRRARKAEITLPPNAPVHGFRSAFAQKLLDEGIADLDLQQLMGHDDIRTTAIYAKRSPDRLRDVHRKYTERAAAPRPRRARGAL